MEGTFNPYIAAGQREQGQQDQDQQQQPQQFIPPGQQPQQGQQGGSPYESSPQQQQQPFQAYQPPGQPRPQQPPPVNVPFTQADSLQLQRLQQGQSEVQRQIDDGEVTPEDGQDLHRQLMARLTPLQAKQQAAQKAAREAQKAALMDQTALQESMEAHNAQVQAQTFPQTVATYTDPVTGRTQHFYQKKRGEMVPMDFAVAKEDEAPRGAAAPGGEGESGGQTGPMTLADYGAIKREQVGAGAKPGSPKILNALGQEIPHKDEYRGPRDVWGRPTQQQDGGDAFSELHRRAEQAVPPLPPNAPEWMHRQREEKVSSLFGRLTSRHLESIEHREKEQAAHNEHIRGEGARQTEAKRREAAASEEARMKAEERRQLAEEKRQKAAQEDKHLTEQNDLAGIRHHREAISRQRDKFQGNVLNEGKELPDDLKPENESKVAIRKHKEDRNALAELRGQQPVQKKTDENDPSGLPPEVAKRPSSIGPERAKELSAVAQHGVDAWNALPAEKKNSDEGKQMGNRLSQMRSILTTAATERRPLTVGERKLYEAHHEELDALLKKTGSGNAGGLRLANPPPSPAKPALPDADPHAHAERVQHLLPIVRAGLDAIPTSETMTGELRGGGLRTHLSALNDILAHAARQKRGLTIGERKEYEENHRLLDAMLRRQGQDADRLKIVQED